VGFFSPSRTKGEGNYAKDYGSSSKALSNFAPRELLSITQAKFLCKRLFRVLLKSFLITAITTAVVINKMVNFMTKNEPGVELNIGFRIFRIVVWITATTGCLALMAWLVAFAWAEIRSLI
jgi:hypothetical protein